MVIDRTRFRPYFLTILVSFVFSIWSTEEEIGTAVQNYWWIDVPPLDQWMTGISNALCSLAGKITRSLVALASDITAL